MRGFTLLELLLVILITGILAAVVAPAIREPMTAYFDVTRRAALVDAAEMALRRMARDARRALPYSLRVDGSSTAFEFVSVMGVARYRENGGAAANRLQFNNADSDFSVLGRFPTIDTTLGNVTLGGNQRLVIFNLGATGYDIYQGDAVASPLGTTVTISDDAVNGEDHVNLNPGHQFADSSPSHRVYIADGTISYACFNNGLYRDADNGYNATQPSPATVSGGVLMTDGVTGCQFDYTPGNSLQPGLLIMSVTLSRDGESVTLLHQVHIPNAT